MLSGHKHVPYAWRLENLFVVNAGTVSTTVPIADGNEPQYASISPVPPTPAPTP